MIRGQVYAMISVVNDWVLELQSVFHECRPGRRKLAVKVSDIFGNDMMRIIEVTI
jgi:hypothetical protein